MRRARAVARAALAAAALALAPLPAPACRLALALGLDISSSVNAAEYAVQKDGLTAALRAPDIVEALFSQDGRVYVAVFEWSGYPQQELIVGWTPLDRPADVAALADRLDAHARSYAVYSTAIGAAARYADGLFAALPEPCARRVLDFSGDGVSNEGPGPDEVRAEGMLAGVVINGLVIKGARPDPEPYYRAHVVAGPGAFVMVARNGFEDYPDMIRAKLKREIGPPLAIGMLP